MATSTFFWNTMATRYSRQPIADEAAYQRKLQVTRTYLRPDMAVLEFGCGTGSTALLHAPFVRHIEAIDSSRKMVDIARSKARDGKVGNVTFRQSSIEEFEAPEASFDAVLGLSILHLLEDRDAAIAKVRRVLKPGGVFVTSTVCAAEMKSYFRHILPIGHFLRILPLVRFFDADDLVKSLTDGGFAIDHQWRQGEGKAVFIVARRD